MPSEARVDDAPLAPASGAYAYQLLWEIAWRRKGRLVAGLFLGVGLAVAACLVFGPWYESTAQILVLKKHLDTAPISGTDHGPAQEDYLSTHMLLLTSSRVVDQAIKKNNLESLPQFRAGRGPTSAVKEYVRAALGQAPDRSPEETVAKEIGRSLVVSRDTAKPGVAPSNEVLNLEFHGRVAGDCPKVLDAVIDSYRDCLKETYRNINSETLALITQARDVVQKDLETKEAAYQEFLKTTPPVWRGKDGDTIHQDRLFNIDSRRSALHVRQAEIEATLEGIDRARKTGGNPASVLALLSPAAASRELVAPDPTASPEPGVVTRNAKLTLEEELINLQLQEENLLRRYGPNHREVQALRTRLETVRRMMVPAAKGSRPEVDRRLEDLVTLKEDLLKQELRDVQAAEKSLAGLFEHEQSAASTSFIHGVEEEAHRKGIERSRLLYESILHRLEEINSVRDFGGFETQVITPPRPGELALKRYALVLGLGLFCGLLCGLGLTYAAEARDRRFRTAREVDRGLGVPVIGQMPRPRAPGLLLGRAARESANGPTPVLPPGTLDGPLAEAYRTLRTVLYVRAGAAGAKVIQITSPAAGDGKTTLAALLGVSIAQSGRSVVVVDADLRGPHVHEHYGLPAKAGLSSVLTGEADLASALRPGPVPGLYVLPGGPGQENPAELLASPRFPEVLDALRGRFDFVLLDTPPLLRVADPAIVAARADQVLLAVRLLRTDRSQGRRALELLNILGARVLGAVVTGVTGRPGPVGDP